MASRMDWKGKPTEEVRAALMQAREQWPICPLPKLLYWLDRAHSARMELRRRKVKV